MQTGHFLTGFLSVGSNEYVSSHQRRRFTLTVVVMVVARLSSSPFQNILHSFITFNNSGECEKW